MNRRIKKKKNKKLKEVSEALQELGIFQVNNILFRDISSLDYKIHRVTNDVYLKLKMEISKRINLKINMILTSLIGVLAGSLIVFIYLYFTKI